ncbi:hypothetical protein Skr01_12440 [Sphaerisporangium krabiense]|uniref:Uncharacterized protein n=1 Tax=Sphaerisporangium krabiense TaxID=763782 RepID=A0A7W8ZCM6_9ACTN|nr:hypothetical protein [Sphaerisporangium krabiense]MBB5631228.1 hypothetical protein [Sphaerisporangium krabiense]GII61159.1 hypothetical protein Skr01_12440 [Sphaerisporangium krabiense]
MSKTDKTRPWWVQMADAPMLTCLPVHDHRLGACTLPDEITAGCAPPFPVEGCHWRVPVSLWFGHRTRAARREGYHIRREDTRRGRHQVRRELRAYRPGPGGDAAPDEIGH